MDWTDGYKIGDRVEYTLNSNNTEFGVVTEVNPAESIWFRVDKTGCEQYVTNPQYISRHTLPDHPYIKELAIAYLSALGYSVVKL